MTSEIRTRGWIAFAAGALLLSAAVGCSSTPPPKDDEPRADPPTTNAELVEGEALVQTGKFADALPHIKAAFAAEPRNAAASYYMGLCIEQTNGDKKEVEKFYKQALGLDPKLVEAAQNLAALYLADPPRPDEAIAVLDKSLSYNPGDPGLLTNLGYAYSVKKDFERAYKAYNKALEKGDTPETRLALGTLLSENKRAEEAVPHLLKAAESKNDDPAALATIARLLGPGKAYKDCVRLLDRAIELKPDVAEFFVRRGVCKHEMKNEAEAGKDFESAIKLDAKYQPAHYYLGLSMLAQGKKGIARDSLKKAYTLGPETKIGKQAKQKLDGVK